MTLLPLKRIEKLEIIDSFSLKLSPAEKSHAKTSTALLIIVFLIICTILYIDWILSHFIVLLKKHLLVDIIQYGIHETNPEVDGKGFVAKYMRSLVSYFRFSEKIFKKSSTKECLPKPKFTEKEEIINIWKYFVLIVILNYTEMYFLRFRRIICGYFYPSRDKKRTLFLYNDRLKKRKGYLRFLTHNVRKIVREKKMNTNIGIRESYALGVLDMLDLGFVLNGVKYILSFFVKKKCIVCEDKEDKNFHKCDDSECNLLYCDQCWNECRQRCLACKPTHISDDSDFSENDL